MCVMIYELRVKPQIISKLAVKLSGKGGFPLSRNFYVHT